MWRQDTTRAAEPRAKLSRRGLRSSSLPSASSSCHSVFRSSVTSLSRRPLSACWARNTVGGQSHQALHAVVMEANVHGGLSTRPWKTRSPRWTEPASPGPKCPGSVSASRPHGHPQPGSDTQVRPRSGGAGQADGCYQNSVTRWHTGDYVLRGRCNSEPAVKVREPTASIGRLNW